VLILGGHREIVEDQEKDEKVVDAEGLFQEVAGQELGAFNRAHLPVDPAIEGQPEGDPERAPPDRLAHRRFVGLAMEDAEIQRQQQKNKKGEAAPVNRWVVQSADSFPLQRAGSSL
jgi:hypothetical protein